MQLHVYSLVYTRRQEKWQSLGEGRRMKGRLPWRWNSIRAFQLKNGQRDLKIQDLNMLRSGGGRCSAGVNRMVQTRLEMLSRKRDHNDMWSAKETRTKGEGGSPFAGVSVIQGENGKTKKPAGVEQNRIDQVHEGERILEKTAFSPPSPCAKRTGPPCRAIAFAMP